MDAFLSALQTVGTFLGIWVLVSVATTIVLIPWFRSQASANAQAALDDRQADWVAAAASDASVARTLAAR